MKRVNKELLAMLLLVTACTQQSAPPPPPGEITLNANPTNVSMVQGTTQNISIQIRRENYSGNVELAATLISGANLALKLTPSLTIGSIGQLSVTANENTPAGNYLIEVTAAAVGTNNVNPGSISLNVTVNPKPDFELSTNQSQVTLTNGTTAEQTINIARSNFPNPITLTLSGLPNGVSYSLSANNTTSNSVGVTLSSSNNVAAGTYSITVIGQSNNLSKTTSFSLRTQAPAPPPPPPDISLSASNLQLEIGTSGNSVLSIVPSNFTGSLNLTCTAPAGITCSAPSALNISGTTTTNIGISLAPAVAAGTYAINLGLSGTVNKSTAFTLTVVNPQYFYLNPFPVSTPSRLRGQLRPGVGSGVPITQVTINRNTGYTNTIYFEIAEVKDPQGNTRPTSDLFTEVIFDDPLIPGNQNFTIAQTIDFFADINTSAALGNWSIKIRGYDAAFAIERFATVTLRIELPFELDLGNENVSLRQGTQLGGVGQNVLPLNVILDSRLVTPSVNLNLSKVTFNNNEITLVKSGGMNYYTGSDCNSNTDACSSNTDVLGVIDQTTGLRIRGDGPSEVGFISGLSGTRYLWPRISPMAQPGVYRYTIQGVVSGDVSVQGNTFTDAGGGQIGRNSNPVIFEKVLAITVEANYLTISVQPTSATFADTSLPRNENVTVTPTLVGDNTGANTAILTAFCSPDLPVVYTLGGIPILSLNPPTPNITILTKTAATASSSIHACTVVANVTVPAEFAWWSPNFNLYYRVATFTLNDQ